MPSLRFAQGSKAVRSPCASPLGTWEGWAVERRETWRLSLNPPFFCPPGVQPGYVVNSLEAGEGDTGVLRSPVFAIRTPIQRFLIAGWDGTRNASNDGDRNWVLLRPYPDGAILRRAHTWKQYPHVYEDGTSDRIPLVIGATAWFVAQWAHGPPHSVSVPIREPFASRPEYMRVLRRALRLRESEAPASNDTRHPHYYLAIRPRPQRIEVIVVVDNPEVLDRRDARGEAASLGALPARQRQINLPSFAITTPFCYNTLVASVYRIRLQER